MSVSSEYIQSSVTSSPSFQECGRRVGEVRVGSQAVPELRQGRRAVVAVQEQARLRRVVELRVVAQQHGLDVGHEPHARLAVAARESLRVGELVAIPGERVAARSDGGVAGGQVERAARQAAPGQPIQEHAICPWASGASV